VDDSNETSANSFSVQITSNGGVFGSRGYVCPRYSMGVYKFEASCDVYSFGIVMIELVTGCIQNDRTRLGNSLNTTSQVILKETLMRHWNWQFQNW
jgi:hypothetical protein